MNIIDERGMVPDRLVFWIERSFSPPERAGVFNGLVELAKSDSELPASLTYPELKQIAEVRGFISD